MHDDKLFRETPILKAILKLAIPTVIGQIILVLYNIADTFFIGLANSDEMLTAITICMPAFMFLSAISNLFGVGGASLIARCLGANKTTKAKNTSSFSIVGCLILTILYSLGTYLFIDDFVYALGGKSILAVRYAKDYLLITVVIGGIFSSMNVLFGHLVRAEGKSLHASIGVALGGILNIVLDPLFMFVLLPKGYEVIGAAAATALSNLIATLYFIILIFFRHKNDTYINLTFTSEMFNDNIPKDVIVVGLPACVMTLFENISYAVLDNLISNNGVALQAGLGVAKKINMLAHNSVRGIAQGVLPLLAYNYSANNHKRMKEAINITLVMTIGVASLCMLASLIFDEALVGIFIRGETLSSTYAIKYLKILCIGAPFSGCAYTFISFFQAIGKGNISFVLAILRKGILDIPLMFILKNIIYDSGSVMATPITDVLCCIVSLIVFRIFINKLNDSSLKV